MDMLVLSVVALLAGWLATLILQRDIEALRWLDVAVGVVGAALVGSLLAPVMGIPTMGEYGLTLSGTFVSWLGAMGLLVVVNLARHGHVRCGRSQARARVQ